MGENTDSAWIPAIEYSVPQILLQDSYGVGAVEGDGQVKTGDLLDYLGVPVNVSAAGAATKDPYCPEINALPLRAYQKIYEDWFRDENIVDPVNLQTGDTIITIIRIVMSLISRIRQLSIMIILRVRFLQLRKVVLFRFLLVLSQVLVVLLMVGL